jgi:hypothetical protein
MLDPRQQASTGPNDGKVKGLNENLITLTLDMCGVRKGRDARKASMVLRYD